MIPLETEAARICVLDRGFVYIGLAKMVQEGKVLQIRNAYCIRRWGTTAGLGQLAQQGKQQQTELDHAGIVRCAVGSVAHLIDVIPEKWAMLYDVGPYNTPLDGVDTVPSPDAIAAAVKKRR